MLVQKITFDLLQSKLDDIRIVQGDSGREILFEAKDLEGPVSYDDYTFTFNLIKPDHTFVIQTLTAGLLTISEQMWIISGTSYYNVRITDSDDNIIYSGQGAFIVDDALITEDDIESVAEVNGYIFPDDFATTDKISEIVEDLGFAKIDDVNTTSGTVWSSLHTWNQIDDQIADAIDDDSISSTKTWSSDKINDELSYKAEINDNATSSQSTWSSEKISQIDTKHIYKTTEQIVGTWIDGRPVYEKTVDCGSMPTSDKQVAHNINNIDLIWIYEGFFMNSVSGYSANFNLSSNSFAGQANVWVSRSVLDIWTGQDRSSFDKVYITLRYVKEV